VKTWGRRRLLEREAVVLNWIIIYKTGQETYFGFYFWGPGIQLELVFGRVKKTFYHPIYMSGLSCIIFKNLILVFVCWWGIYIVHFRKIGPLLILI